MRVESSVRAGLVRDRQESEAVCRHLLHLQSEAEARRCREESQAAVQHAVHMAAQAGRQALTAAVQRSELWCTR